ncbi:MAG: hypothetical protein Q9210_000518 [Variospora velana]
MRSQELRPAPTAGNPQYNNNNELGLGRLPPRDPTLQSSADQRGPGPHGAGERLPPVRGYHTLPAQDPRPQLPSMHDTRHAIYPGLPPMSQLVRMSLEDAQHLFINARRAFFPNATLQEHQDDFRTQWEEQVRQDEVAAAAAAEEYDRRVLAGTVPGHLPMGDLVHLPVNQAQDIFYRARRTALPNRPRYEHLAAFRSVRDEHLRRSHAAAATGTATPGEEFARRVLAGTVPNLPLMGELLHSSYDEAIRVFVRARRAVLPNASDQDHVISFRSLRAEQLRRDNAVAEENTRRAEENSRRIRALNDTQGNALERGPSTLLVLELRGPSTFLLLLLLLLLLVDRFLFLVDPSLFLLEHPSPSLPVDKGLLTLLLLKHNGPSTLLLHVDEGSPVVVQEAEAVAVAVVVEANREADDKTPSYRLYHMRVMVAIV